MDCEALEATAMPHDGSPRVLRVLLIASLAELPSLGPASGWTLGLVDDWMILRVISFTLW